MRKFFSHHRLVWASLVLATALLLASLSAGPTQSLAAAAPKITIAPTTALPNQFVAITGENFTPGGGATLSSLTIGAVTIDTDKINFGYPVKLDTSGGFVTNLVIPLNSATLAAGSKTITATDSGNISASAALTISTPSIPITPTSSRAGSTVTVTGSNYPVASSNLGTDQVPAVTISYYLTASNYEQVATAYPDSTGGFTTTFKVPANVTIPSTDNVVKAIMSGASLQPIANHSIVKPSVSISPSSGDPGTAVTITGIDFNSFIQVNSLTIGPERIADPAKIYTDLNGKLTVNATIPKLDAGTQPISIQVGGKIYTLTFTVTGTTSTVSSSQPATIPNPITYPLNSQLSPLGANLIRIFHFSNATKEWSFYDPKSDIAPYATLTELVIGKAYWIKVKRAQATVIGGTYRDLFQGWNLVAW